MKRILSVFLVFLFLIPPAMAAKVELASYNSQPEGITWLPDVSGIAPMNDETELETIIKDGLEAMDEYIDLSGFGIKLEQWKDGNYYFPDEIVSLYKLVLHKDYKLFYVDLDFYYSCVGIEIEGIWPIYTMTDKTAIAQRQAAMDAAIEEYIDLLDECMTDAEKLLVLHDKMAMECAYEDTEGSHSAAGVFVDRKAVCEGYATAYYHLATLAGVPTGFVESPAMNHIWNISYIDGNWYHIDVTWDDPIYANIGNWEGRLSHGDFMKSNEELMRVFDDNGNKNQRYHYGFTPIEGADNTKYDRAFWHDTEYPIMMLGHNMYFTGENGIKRYNTITEEFHDIIPLDKVYWWVNDKYVYSDKFCSFLYDDGRFYYNTPYEIKSVDVYGEDERTEKKVFNKKDRKSIYSLYIEDGMLKYTAGPSDLSTLEVLEYGGMELPENTESRMLFITDEYVSDGKKHISYVNNTGRRGNFFSMLKDESGLTDYHLEINEITGKRAGTADIENTDVLRVFIWDENYSPIKTSHVNTIK